MRTFVRQIPRASETKRRNPNSGRTPEMYPEQDVSMLTIQTNIASPHRAGEPEGQQAYSRRKRIERLTSDTASTSPATMRPVWWWPTPSATTSRSWRRAFRNANDGVSTLQIIGTAASTTSPKVLDRLKTLATEAASDTFTGSLATLGQGVPGPARVKSTARPTTSAWAPPPARGPRAWTCTSAAAPRASPWTSPPVRWMPRLWVSPGTHHGCERQAVDHCRDRRRRRSGRGAGHGGLLAEQAGYAIQLVRLRSPARPPSRVSATPTWPRKPPT